ncbi:MAG: response regulator transcription factor [Planctomycetes bacterium]|nr:response regulator transcription factor [Planctomycetota bacterium]
MTDAKILVVEDDESLALVLSDALGHEGYRALVERDGQRALERATATRFDLVILDLMLPTLDGTEVCRRLRRAGVRTPVLMLTARGREEDRVRGLDAGADDYVTKPFSVRELLARVRARLRATTAPPSDVVRMGDAEVDFVAHVLRRGGAEVALTKTELGMLRVFARNPGVVLPRARFLDEVWGLRSFPTTRTVDMHVLRLREKLGDVGDEPRHLRTVHGVGYRYDP